MSTVFFASFLGIGALSASVAWAESANPAMLSSNIGEDIKMEKIIYSEDMLPARIPSGMSKIRSSNDAELYSSGERYFPVMLVSTTDYKALDSAFMYRMFNEKGFKDNGNYGSVHDYFVESSGGQFQPTFDIYPITLPKNFSSYKSDSEFILPAIDILVERSDFKARASKYEKEIPFIILHPLSRDKATSYCSDFFNHQYKLQYSAKQVYSKNGYKFNNYAFVSQKAEGKESSTNSKDVNMLGTFVHEFSHVIGLQDTYSNDSRGYATIGPLPYDVMALGLRNGNGGYPPTFSAFEREAVGWLKPTEIANADSVYELKNLSGMQAYAVSNPNKPDEYFLIEYRPAVGFDSKIGSSAYSGKQGKNGVMIWYIDYDYSAFFSNDPNGDENHQRVEVRTVLSKDQESFAKFDFVNKNGKAKIDGIFNLVFDGDDRVCFTVNKSKKLDKCPEKVIASSSSAPQSSSSSIQSSSSKETPKSSSSRASEYSSSSQNVGLVAEAAASGMRIHVSRGMLNVDVPRSGKKNLRFYDALGNEFRAVSFENTSASVDVSGWNSPIFVRLDINGNMKLAKRVQLR
jgi:M6 family metalloprotease-like protein